MISAMRNILLSGRDGKQQMANQIKPEALPQPDIVRMTFLRPEIVSRYRCIVRTLFPDEALSSFSSD